MDSSNKENEQVARPNIVDKLSRLCQDKPKTGEGKEGDRKYVMKNLRKWMEKHGMRP